jgi:hypothetical protein
MKPELQSNVEKVTQTLGISAHARGELMDVDLNWEQLSLFFGNIYDVLVTRHRSIMGSITRDQWVKVYQTFMARRVLYVRECAYGVPDPDMPRIRLSKYTWIHGAAFTILAHVGLYQSQQLGFRFIPGVPPRAWALVDNEAMIIHADVIAALRSRGVVISEGFPSEPTGSMAYLLLVRDYPEHVVASAPSSEATPNDGMMASVIFQTKVAMALGYGYDFSPVATPNIVIRGFIAAYMGGACNAED